MDTIDLIPRQAHVSGHTSLAYKTDGSELVSVGADTVIRVFKTSLEERNADPKSIDYPSGVLEAVAVHKNHFATSGEDGKVAMFNAFTNKFEKFLVRSTVPVRSLAFNKDGTKLAVATDENVIRIVLLADIVRTVNLRGHTAAVKCCVFDPKDEYLISLDCQGDVYVWDIRPDTLEPQCIQKIAQVVAKTREHVNRNRTIAWRPDGACFAIAGKNQDLIVYTRNTWTVDYTLKNGHVDTISALAWSPQGNCIATTSPDCQVIVWDTHLRTIHAKYTVSAQVTCLAWSPYKNELSLADIYGQIMTWDEAGPKKPKVVAPTLTPNALPSNAVDDLFVEDELAGLDGLFDEDDDVEMSDTGDFVVDDDGAGYVDQITTDPSAAASRFVRSKPGAVVDLTPHPFIYSGATPFLGSKEPTVGDRRYLAFDMFGIIYTIFHDTYSMINVEFHDLTDHKNFHFRDFHQYSVAALHSKGVVLGAKRREATETEEDTGTVSSVLYYRPLEMGANRVDWTVSMPEGEDIQTVAINNVSVIATTSNGRVRVFSLSGLQTHLFYLGDVVSAVGASDKVFLTYSPLQSINGIHRLDFSIMNTETFETIQTGTLPLNKHRQITWTGFSESLQPTVYDSDDQLYILHHQWKRGQSHWVPVFDGKATAARHERTERYWPIGLMREEMMCLILRGANQHPYFPRPQVHSVPLLMPTTQLETESGQLEEKFLRTKLMSMHEREEASATSVDASHEFKKMDVAMDKTLLQLIQMACKADKQQRVVDLASALVLSRSIDAAIKLSSYYGFTRVAEQITRIKEVGQQTKIHGFMILLGEVYAAGGYIHAK
ncbi:WD40-repeat-containing domain protein [Spinellus fusiger]|nr:WD40-repeat-containing domain protein [Spinellus fusiger]